MQCGNWWAAALASIDLAHLQLADEDGPHWDGALHQPPAEEPGEEFVGIEETQPRRLPGK